MTSIQQLLSLPAADAERELRKMARLKTEAQMTKIGRCLRELGFEGRDDRHLIFQEVLHDAEVLGVSAEQIDADWVKRHLPIGTTVPEPAKAEPQRPATKKRTADELRAEQADVKKRYERAKVKYDCTGRTDRAATSTALDELRGMQKRYDEIQELLKGTR